MKPLTTGLQESPPGEGGEKFWELWLYVAGKTPTSLRALDSLKEICENRLAGRYTVEVVDLMENRQLAAGEKILALPTLVRKLPEPIKKLIGDLSHTERVLVGLDIMPATLKE